MSEVSIQIGSSIHNYFEAVSVFQNIDSLCGQFKASTSNHNEADLSKWGISMKDAVKVLIGNTSLCNGYLDNLFLDYGPEFNELEIDGRDKTMDLVDCTPPEPFELKGQTYLAIIKKLVQPFGIAVTVKSSASAILSKAVEIYTADIGETAAALIGSICRDIGLLAMSLGDGKLTLATSADATEVMKDPIQFGQNAKYGGLRRSNVNRFSDYAVKGMGISTDNKGIADYTSPAGTASDSLITRTRPLTILSEGAVNNSICKSRASFEAMLRAGKSAMITYEVSGWEQSDGSIWKLFSKARVKDSFLNIDETMLISSLLFEYNKEEGKTTSITVVNKDTYSSANAGNVRTVFDS